MFLNEGISCFEKTKTKTESQFHEKEEESSKKKNCLIPSSKRGGKGLKMVVWFGRKDCLAEENGIA